MGLNKMKPIIAISSFVVLILSILISCSHKKNTTNDSFSVYGTIQGLSSEFMSTSYMDNEKNRVHDSIFVKNESFFYTAKIKEPTFIVIWPNVERTMKHTEKGLFPVKSSQFAFLAEPGDKIEFKGEILDFVNAYPSGTDANNDLYKINSSIYPLLNQSANMLLKKLKLSKEDPLYTALDDSINILNEKVIGLKKKFITSNPSSKAAAWYLSDMMLRKQISNEEAIKAFNSINKSIESYPFYKEIASRIEGIELTEIGKTVPDFVTNATVNGIEFRLDSLRGKYILIDFWGTWCAPCVAEMPKVKEYQDKYKEELVVLGINSGDSKERIVKFISSKGYNWIQVMSNKGNENLVLKFNVTAFPTKFIIDPQGVILYRSNGSGDEAFKMLDKLLK